MRANDGPNTYIPKFRRLRILTGRGYEGRTRLFQGRACPKDSSPDCYDFCPWLEDSFDFMITFPPEIL